MLQSEVYVVIRKDREWLAASDGYMRGWTNSIINAKIYGDIGEARKRKTYSEDLGIPCKIAVLDYIAKDVE